MSDTPVSGPGTRWIAPRWTWAALAALASLLAIPGFLTRSQVFFVRDLATSFFPHHLWFRVTLFQGQLPFWNPYLGCGYSTLADPVFQTLFPPTLLLRLLPAAIGFNAIVALPFAVAALGTYFFLRRHVAAPSASLGAIVFGASGPVLSAASMPNLSWSCACIPWILAGVDGIARVPSPRRVAALAATFGAMLLAGEPVTFAATVALATAYATSVAPAATEGRRPRTKLAIATLAAVVLGVALAAVQLVPAVLATSRSIRAAGMLRDMWSLHPARLLEFVSPFVFGKYVGLPHEITQWLFVLNDRREPLLISLYLGAPVLLLAFFGVIVAPKSRWSLFWCGVGAVFLLAALGSHTPLYRIALRELPVLKLLRYPSKLVELTTFSIAILAAQGWDALTRGARISHRQMVAPVGLAALFAFASVAVFLMTAPFEAEALRIAERLGVLLDVPDPSAASHSLVRAFRSAAPRLFGLAVAGGAGLMLAASSRREARLARGALFVLICADLVLTNAPINPTIDASVLLPPDWVRLTQEHPRDRLFVARNLIDEQQPLDDAPPRIVYPPDTPPVAYRAAYDAALASDLSPSAVSLTLSRELTGLRPREYFTLLSRFGASDRAMRYRFLSWAGTRYFLVASTPPIAAAKLTALPALGSVALYEMAPSGGRVVVASNAVVEPSVDAQIDRLFAPDFDPVSTVLVDHEPPPPAATRDPAGAPGPPTATIVAETATSVLVDATAPEVGGYLVFLDSFDPGWNARLDGRDVSLLRADGVFRAVRLPAGRHAIEFVFRPDGFLIGAVISLSTLLVLAVAVTRRR